MLDLKTQSQFVDATASIMRAYMRAASETFAASAGRSLSLWSEVLQSSSPGNGVPPQPAALPVGMSPAGWMAAPRLAAPWSAQWPAWPWMSGNPAGMSWAPLAQAWWLGPSVKFWAPLTDWGAWGRGALPGWSSSTAQVVPAPQEANGAARPAPDAGYASHRSAGGHAVAQVIVPTIEEWAEITAKATLTPVQSMLGVWRTALGA